MRVGIIIIATGTYTDYLDRLIPSIQRYFLPEHQRTIFCLCDNNRPTTDSIVCAPWKHEPWPLNTLHKFRAINSISSLYWSLDALFYIDADMEVIAPTVDSELLPSLTNPICGVLHCGWLGEQPDPYERNPASLACVSDNKATPYYQGCLFGGLREPFLNMTWALEQCVDLDMERSLIAKYHDESHLNRWFVEHPPKSIPRTYARPVAMGPLLPGTKIIHVEKDNATLRQGNLTPSV